MIRFIRHQCVVICAETPLKQYGIVNRCTKVAQSTECRKCLKGETVGTLEDMQKVRDRVSLKVISPLTPASRKEWRFQDNFGRDYTNKELRHNRPNFTGMHKEYMGILSDQDITRTELLHLSYYPHFKYAGTNEPNELTCVAS